VITHLLLSYSSLPIGNSLRARLRKKIHELHLPRELRAIHTAVTGSILYVLSEQYIDKSEVNKKRWMINDHFKVLLTLSIKIMKLNCDVISHVMPFQKM
jgi:hypothetical protein